MIITDQKPLTKTAAQKQLRKAAALARWTGGLSKHLRVEVGTRAIPVHAATITGAIDGTVWAAQDGDDLDDLILIRDTKFYAEQMLFEGYVAHLFFHDEFDIVDVVTVWVGTSDADPIIIY